MVVCAVTRGAELGVDVEPLSRGGEILALADRIFTREECLDLRTLAPELARERAVSLWTLKEAYAKARGLGLSLAFDGFGFSFDEQGRPRIAFGPGLEDDPERWAFALHDASGHRIAIAVERLRGDPEFRVHFGVPLC
jgi:4'-phosphopantetheinyl transferase